MNKNIIKKEYFFRSVNIKEPNEQLHSDYIVTESVKQIFSRLADGAEAGQGSFTWVGAYGSGKSSASLLLSDLLCNHPSKAKFAEKVLPKDFSKKIRKKFIPNEKQSKILIPAVGRTHGLVRDIASAIPRKFCQSPDSIKTVDDLIQCISKTINNKDDGALILLDEAGIQLENCDIFEIQQLAEGVNRFKGKIVLLLVLHNAFTDYAVSYNFRIANDWKKVSGRFQEISFNLEQGEQIRLIAQALKNYDSKPYNQRVYSVLAKNITADKNKQAQIKTSFADCLPVHPVVTLLLSLLPETGYGQLQRSIFRFLLSKEPFGFQHFLDHHKQSGKLYPPSMFWDYLATNYRSDLISSNTRYRFNLCEKVLHHANTQPDLNSRDMDLLKTICAVSLFAKGDKIISKTLINTDKLIASEGSIARLQDKKLVVYRAFSDFYVPFGGSDFNLDAEIRNYSSSVDNDLIVSYLTQFFCNNTIHPRRFNFKHGTRHILPLQICTDSNYDEHLNFIKDGKEIGCVLVVLSTTNNNRDLRKKINDAAHEKNIALVLKIMESSEQYLQIARRYAIVKQIKEGEIADNDAIAMSEINLYLSQLSENLEAILEKFIYGEGWQTNGHNVEGKVKSLHELADIALRESLKQSPRILSELVCVRKASGAAASAAMKLMKRMIASSQYEKLEIEKNPAEYGLYKHLLGNTKLHQNISNVWQFVDAEKMEDDPCKLKPLWRSCSEHLKERSSYVALKDIYRLWRSPPYGVMPSVIPLLILSYILSKESNVSIRYDGNPITGIDNEQADVLWRTPEHFEIKLLNTSNVAKLGKYKKQLGLPEATPLEVARKIFADVRNLPDVTKNCSFMMSDKAKKVKNIVLSANDPNDLLFKDLPKILGNGKDALSLTGILDELKNHHKILFDDFKDTLFKALNIDKNGSNIEEIKGICSTIAHKRYDYQISAFSRSLMEYLSSNSENFQSVLISLMSKGIEKWTDDDIRNLKDLIRSKARKLLTIAKIHEEGKESPNTISFTYMSDQDILEETVLLSFVDKKKTDKIERVLQNLRDKYGNEQLLASMVKVGKSILASSEKDGDIDV